MITMDANMCYVFRRLTNRLLSRVIIEGSWRKLDLNLILENENRILLASMRIVNSTSQKQQI